MRRMHDRVAYRGFLAGLVTTIVPLVAAAASADQVTSKGTVLHGKITSLSSTSITFEPEYGKGALTIKWEDVEDLKTDGNFQVLYGEDEEVDSPLAGFTEDTLFAGPAVEGATQIPVASIHSGFPIGPDGPSWRDRVRSAMRYWDGNFDLAFNAQQATIDTTGLLIDFKTTRKKDPTRLTFGASYRYATQKDERQNPPTSTTQDSLYGLLRGEYDIIPRLYGFASGEATYDAVQRLSIRGIPKAGLGYLFWEQLLDEEERNFLAGEVGGAWVFERYFQSTDTPDNDYFAVALSAVAGYHLPYGAHFDGRVDYLPAVDDFTGDYLLRSEAGLTLPLIDPIAAKFSILDEYDSTPARDTKHNSLFINIGLSLVW
jgi:Protein of unknown function, DUF481